MASEPPVRPRPDRHPGAGSTEERGPEKEAPDTPRTEDVGDAAGVPHTRPAQAPPAGSEAAAGGALSLNAATQPGLPGEALPQSEASPPPPQPVPPASPGDSAAAGPGLGTWLGGSPGGPPASSPATGAPTGSASTGVPVGGSAPGESLGAGTPSGANGGAGSQGTGADTGSGDSGPSTGNVSELVATAASDEVESTPFDTSELFVDEAPVGSSAKSDATVPQSAARPDALATEALARIDSTAPPARPESPGATTQPSRPTSTAMERAADVLKQVRLVVTPETRHATLQLAPAHLGRVSVRIEIEGGDVSAVLRADQPETVSVLQNHVPELKSLLEQAGFDASKVEIELGQPDDGDFTPQSQDSSDRPRTPSNKHSGGSSPRANEDGSAASLDARNAALTQALAERIGLDTYA